MQAKGGSLRLPRAQLKANAFFGGVWRGDNFTGPVFGVLTDEVKPLPAHMAANFLIPTSDVQ